MNIKKLLPKRVKNSHKGTYGKVLNVAGSKNYTGAAYLSSIAALKVGCGYVTLASSDNVCSTVASLTPDITFLPLSNLDDLENKICEYNVISVGCGLTTNNDAIKLVEFVLENAVRNKVKTVIDADGLNILSMLNIDNLGANFILSPHPKELSRLLKIDVDEIQDNRIKYAQIAADKFNCTIILKGCNTIVATKEEFYENKTGNSALAKAGTGDVLTGMVAGLLAQGILNFDAARLGVYLHGKIADIYSKKYSEYSMLASDMINYIKYVI